MVHATPAARCPDCGLPTAWRDCTGDISGGRHTCRARCPICWARFMERGKATGVEYHAPVDCPALKPKPEPHEEGRRRIVLAGEE